MEGNLCRLRGGVHALGTETHGRALHVPAVLTFGTLWGVCEGALFLAMAAALALLAVFGSPRIFVLLQVIALVASTWSMRFPGPTSR